MPLLIPPAQTLLEAAANDLERDVLPALAGLPRFRARIILNVLRLVTRELQQSPLCDAAERERLQALLSSEGGELAELRADLACRIDSGTLSIEDETLVAHLTQTLREALAIDSPSWIGETRAD